VAEFKEWPKTPLLFRDVTTTEKIDGTNAAIHIEEDGTVTAQSRKRLITPADDNFGFARWVDDNHDALQDTLGVGTHFGEWWGSGIQRGYGLAKGEKRFSLFNVSRYRDVDLSAVPGLGVVPELYAGPFRESEIQNWLGTLEVVGSFACPGFMKPEGLVVFHVASNQVFKVTLENDGLPKTLVSA